MASASARKKRRYAQTHDVYGNLAYAPRPERVPQRDGSELPRLRPKKRPKERALVRPKVRVREAGQVSLFAVAGFLAVGVFAVLLTLGSVQLTMVSNEMVSLREELSALQTEEAKLMAEYELAYDLGAMEERVTADGSMVKPQAGQIYTRDLSEEDSVVHYGQEETGDTAGGILGALRELVDGCLSYFS